MSLYFFDDLVAIRHTGPGKFETPWTGGSFFADYFLFHPWKEKKYQGGAAYFVCVCVDNQTFWGHERKGKKKLFLGVKKRKREKFTSPQDLHPPLLTHSNNPLLLPLIIFFPRKIFFSFPIYFEKTCRASRRKSGQSSIELEEGEEKIKTWFEIVGHYRPALESAREWCRKGNRDVEIFNIIINTMYKNQEIYPGSLGTSVVLSACWDCEWASMLLSSLADLNNVMQTNMYQVGWQGLW